LLGIAIDRREENENPKDFIRGNDEFDSNEICGSNSQYEKHDDQRISTLLGTATD
jgi:hypothetical protein